MESDQTTMTKSADSLLEEMLCQAPETFRSIHLYNTRLNTVPSLPEPVWVNILTGYGFTTRDDQLAKLTPAEVKSSILFPMQNEYKLDNFKAFCISQDEHSPVNFFRVTSSGIFEKLNGWIITGFTCADRNNTCVQYSVFKHHQTIDKEKFENFLRKLHNGFDFSFTLRRPGFLGQ